jgi:hypothetical protein
MFVGRSMTQMRGFGGRMTLVAALGATALLAVACGGSVTAPTATRGTGLNLTFATPASGLPSAGGMEGLLVGGTLAFQAAVTTASNFGTPSSETVIRWSSADPAIARVEADSRGTHGTITGVSPGQTTLSAAFLGKTVKVAVQVVAAP